MGAEIHNRYFVGSVDNFNKSDIHKQTQSEISKGDKDKNKVKNMARLKLASANIIITTPKKERYNLDSHRLSANMSQDEMVPSKAYCYNTNPLSKVGSLTSSKDGKPGALNEN
jgi:hypothetical protein